MKLYTGVLIILLLMIAIPDIYFYLKLKDRNARPIYIIIHLSCAVLFTTVFLYMKFGLESLKNFRIVVWIMWMYFFFLLIYIPKFLHILFNLIGYIYKKIFKHENIYFVVFRIALSVFVVLTMLISAYITPRNFEIVRIKVLIPNLPKAFERYKIVQISDIHLGSWNGRFEKFKPVIKLVNEQHPDIIVFSGDMINNFSGETTGWEPYFKELKTKNGKYAVLGNHDYGDYTEWENTKERIDNRLLIKKSIRDFGFRLLLNENIYLKKGSDSLLLVGVENWGKNQASHYSNLSVALRGCMPESPKILISHDPTQWDAEIIGRKDIVLTLSGHTHAAQLGMKIGDRLFSPAAFVFKHWAGLYKFGNQYIYVNRGIGYIGLPMFIGVRPEVTVLELIRKEDVTI